MKKGLRILTACLILAYILGLCPMFPKAQAAEANCASPEGKTLSVMSFNVLNNNSKDSSGNFKYDPPATREKAIVSMIKAYKPDIIGMQEAGQGGDSGTLNWCSALNTDLKSIYAYRSLKDDTGLALDVYRGLIIFYNKSRFTLVSSGGQGYSDPANNKRAFQWVKLKDNQTNVEFFVFNTHWQYEGSQTLEQNTTVRAKHMKELAAKVKSLAGSTHFIVTGDFNSSYTQKSGSLCDGENIAKFVATNSTWADGVMTATEKYSINASGTQTALQASDSALQTGVDHIVYPTGFYEANRLRKIQCRTYSPMLSDHDAYLVDFTYKMPGLSVTASEGQLDAHYSNGAYYIDNLAKRTTDLPITVKLSNGSIYSDEACTASAGTSLTIKTGSSQTYRPDNTLYIKWGGMVQTLYLRTCNANTMVNSVFVDQSMIGREVGTTTLYCDKWYCRLVTVGVNGFTTIQAAVDAAGDGYQILVAPGTYTEEVSYTGKSLKFYGQNRTNLKALVIKNGQLTVNSANRTYETYLSGSITYNVGSQTSSSLMVNGFHFLNRTATGQVRIAGGTVEQTVDLRICNNLFNCYTDGAASNGSAVHGITPIRKTGSIEDNYFHLTKIPTYTDSSGKTVNYTNRGISLRNLGDMSIIANYFDGYTGSMLRPFWLSSEVASGSTVTGNGNVAILANRFENSYPGALNINNIRGSSTANVMIAGNSYGGEVMNVTFTDTANQTSQNLPTDKSKITFQVQTADYSNLKITDGPTCKKFSYYVTFRNEDGMYIYGNSVVSGTTATYKGASPTKTASSSTHYTFANWVTEKNGTTVADLSKISASTDVYASFTGTAHTEAVRNQKTATCTEAGHSGERYCTVCNYVISAGSEIPALGHSVVTIPGKDATCTEEGLTAGESCSICNCVLTAQEVIPASGHSYVYNKINALTHKVTCEHCDYAETADHTYVDGSCICGEPEIKETQLNTSLKLYHSLNLASDISVNFAIPAAYLKGFDMDTVYVETRYYDYVGNEQGEEKVIRIAPVLNGYYYYFTLEGLTAIHMTNELTSVLYGTKDGQPYYSPVDEYS
ncbi:MAG: endonuclease/exonuclease/phosphatase family protein, partial [Oscillospiraceae bacterium]|nr:endonuclease/exonuclease/phosphatase family protein [Oscillospiraceae bacterium]